MLRWAAILIALGCFGWVARDEWQRRQFQASLELAFESPKAPDLRLPVKPSPPLTRLRIDRLGIQGVIQEGFDPQTLGRAIGHHPRSSRPGARGNVLLAAHRDTFFAGLRDIHAGDVILLETSSGAAYRYRVTGRRIVDKSDNRVMRLNAREKARRLTLITCYPFDFAGPAPERLVVEARLES